MLYDTIYRHNQALGPDDGRGVTLLFDGLVKAIEDCRRAGKVFGRDAAVLLLIRQLAAAAETAVPDPAALRAQCDRDRTAILARPALLLLAGHALCDDPAAKRTFHNEARRALLRIAAAFDAAPDSARVVIMPGGPGDDGGTELHHRDVGVRVVPRSFVPDGEVSLFRCSAGLPAGRSQRVGIAALLDATGFANRLAALRAPGPALRAAA